MISFYSEWQEAITDGRNSDDHIQAFLNWDPRSMRPLLEGSESDQRYIHETLTAVPLTDFFRVLADMDVEPVYDSSQIPCFSSFANGAHRLVELLEFEPEGFTFESAGYELAGSTNKLAQIKYGENHTKLARQMSLVTINTDSCPWIITSTPWGKYLMNYELDQKQDILKKLLLRDDCIKNIIHPALNTDVNYRQVVHFLMDSTAIRRRSNVRALVRYILEGSAQEEAFSRINWKV